MTMGHTHVAALVLFARRRSRAPGGGRSMSPSKSPTKSPARTPATIDGNSRRAGAKGGNGAVTDDAALQELLRALRAAKDGDFSVRLPERKTTLLGQIGSAFNDLVEMSAKSNKEL